MIRYVLVSVLAVSLLALGVAATDYVGTHNSEKQVESNVVELETAATSLMEDETPPPEGHPPPRRVVEMDFPSDSLSTHGLAGIEFERLSSSATRVRYTLTNGAERQMLIDQPLVYNDPDNPDDTFRFASARHLVLVLTLEATSDGEPIVVVNIRRALDSESVSGENARAP